MTTYLLSVHGTQGDPTPSDEAMQASYAAVDVFNKELQGAGSWVFAGGLFPPDVATTARPQGDDVLITDGPYAESKEFLGGFWIITAADLDEALDWAKRGARACGGAVEVRPFQGDGDGDA